MIELGNCGLKRLQLLSNFEGELTCFCGGIKPFFQINHYLYSPNH